MESDAVWWNQGPVQDVRSSDSCDVQARYTRDEHTACSLHTTRNVQEEVRCAPDMLVSLQEEIRYARGMLETLQDEIRCAQDELKCIHPQLAEAQTELRRALSRVERMHDSALASGSAWPTLQRLALGASVE